MKNIQKFTMYIMLSIEIVWWPKWNEKALIYKFWTLEGFVYPSINVGKSFTSINRNCWVSSCTHMGRLDHFPSNLKLFSSKVVISIIHIMPLTSNLMYWTEPTGLKGCNGGKDCLGAEGVLRVSLGCFVSFSIICMKIFAQDFI